MATDPLHSQLGTLLAPHARVAYLFGSAARGTAGPHSDLDIAFLPKSSDLALREELELGLALEQIAQRPVDLVRLDEANTLLRWRVARDGVLLCAEPSAEDVRFRVRAALEHADLAPLLAHHGERLRRRLAEEGSR